MILERMAAAGEEVKLVGGWASPFVIRVRIALNLKGLGYEFFQEEFGKKSELLLKSNPVYKKIPVLIHNGKPICESMIILEYVDEVWASVGLSILPADPYDRAIARFWAAFLDDKAYSYPGNIITEVCSHVEKLLGVGSISSQPHIMEDTANTWTLRGLNEEAKAEAAEQVATALQLLEDAFAKCSKGKGFFGGETIGYLDIAFGCYLGWIKAVEKMTGIKTLDEAKTPMLVGWAARFCSADAVKEVMPEADKLIEFTKKIQAITTAAPAR